MRDMSDRIREERLRKNMSQEELGLLIGIQKSGIAKYESGRVQNIPVDRLEILASALGVTSSYLTGSLERDLLSLDYTITHHTDGMVSVADYPDASYPVTFSAEEWRELEMRDPESFRLILEKLDVEKKKKENPSGISAKGMSEIEAIFSQLTPSRRSKLLELARLYLDDQRKTEESE